MMLGGSSNENVLVTCRAEYLNRVLSDSRTAIINKNGCLRAIGRYNGREGVRCTKAQTCEGCQVCSHKVIRHGRGFLEGYCMRNLRKASEKTEAT